ncbi:hypothetical protein COO60DRAFT_1700411 [Scenedesmus sp. NREL 46B-D3]|nr:hypothetical protein COO60DRAFT_1700411 [Scenedesmus sp. NREL 46B-D3]
MVGLFLAAALLGSSLSADLRARPPFFLAAVGGLVEAWACGASWQAIMANTSIDEGDKARLLARTADMLKQPADGLPLSPTGVSWQDAGRTAAVAAAARSSKDEESQKPASIRPSARRCLCLTLTQQQRDETLGAAASAALPPVAPFTPLPGKCSISSSTPGSAWSAVPAEATAAAPSAHGGSSSSVCSHGSSSNRSRLQAWLSTMELQLQVPATPLVPPVEPCPAPKGGHSRADAHDSRKRALDAEALSELRLAPGPAAAGTGAAAMKAAGDAERSRKRRNSSSEAVSAAAAVQIAAAVDGMPPGADAAGPQGAHMTGDSPVAGVAAAAVPDDLEAAAAAAGWFAG